MIGVAGVSGGKLSHELPLDASKLFIALILAREVSGDLTCDGLDAVGDRTTAGDSISAGCPLTTADGSNG